MNRMSTDKAWIIGHFDEVVYALVDRGAVIDGDMRVLAAGCDIQPLYRWWRVTTPYRTSPDICPKRI